jgi:hypothetical protein
MPGDFLPAHGFGSLGKDAYHPTATDDFLSDIASVLCHLLYDVFEKERDSPQESRASAALQPRLFTRRWYPAAWSSGRS